MTYKVIRGYNIDSPIKFIKEMGDNTLTDIFKKSSVFTCGICSLI